MFYYNNSFSTYQICDIPLTQPVPGMPDKDQNWSDWHQMGHIRNFFISIFSSFWLTELILKTPISKSAPFSANLNLAQLESKSVTSAMNLACTYRRDVTSRQTHLFPSCHFFSTRHRVGRFVPKVGQIGIKWDQIRRFASLY